MINRWRKMKGCFLNWPDVIAAIIVRWRAPCIWANRPRNGGAPKRHCRKCCKTAYTRHIGAICGDVARAANAALARHGFEKSGRCGYSIGLGYPPDWGEKTMSFRPEDETEIKPGMTFHFMPGLWLEDWGIEITESIEISEIGANALADCPRKLLVKNRTKAV